MIFKVGLCLLVVSFTEQRGCIKHVKTTPPPPTTTAASEITTDGLKCESGCHPNQVVLLNGWRDNSSGINYFKPTVKLATCWRLLLRCEIMGADIIHFEFNSKGDLYTTSITNDGKPQELELICEPGRGYVYNTTKVETTACSWFNFPVIEA